MLELDCSQEFDPRQQEQFFAAVPERPGILLIEMSAPGAHPHLVRTADLRRAAERLLRPPEPGSKRLNLREVAARIRYRLTGSKFEQMLALYQHARANFPDRYGDLLRLRPAALLKVNLRNDYPRCYVTRRPGADGGFYFGPFASRRAADAFSESFLDLFKIRRCQIKIRRDPSFAGCIYSEMKMCLAPCFAGCTRQEYDAEVGRVLEGLNTAGDALRTTVEREREAASEALDFERAAALHKRLEKISAALRGLPELARRIQDLDAVILERGVQERTIAVFPLHAGILGEPSFLDFAELSSQPRSVEAILREKLKPPAREDAPATNGAEPETSDPQPANRRESTADWRERYGLREAPKELAEHLSLVARWFYSKPREGEILFREDDWPYRRILRACGRLLAPGAPASAEAQQGERVKKFLPES
jgi:excinuclease ABC subunit C